MFEAIERFVVDNFVFVLVGAVVFVIVADEALGLSRAVFGDDDDAARERPPARDERDAPQTRDDAEETPDDGTPTVDDLLDPPKRE